MSWQRVRIDIPEDFTPEQREFIGQEIVEIIRKRSESGYGVKEVAPGRFEKYRFPAYSKTYKDSLDFAIAGKGSTPNLTLSGDMLIALDVLSHRPGSVLIGYENGTEENDRAEGNQLGSYGGAPNPRKARSFLGVTESELNAILRKAERQGE